MNKRLNIISRLTAIACISAFALTSVPLATDSYARDRDGRGGKYSREYRMQDRHDRRGAGFERAFRRHDRKAVRSYRRDHRRDRRHVISPPAVRHRHVMKRYPSGYKRFWYNRRPYFYSRGIFYRSYPGGFFSVSAPVGAIVLSLPVGYQSLWVDGTTYYVHGGTYFRRVPAGYVIVDPPPAAVMKEPALEIVPPEVSARGQVIVDAPVLNVRSGPSLNETKIYQLDEGYVLEVNGRSDGWLYVRLPNGEYGWVKSVFTKPAKPGNG